jgi:hypothetical protein
MRSSGPPRDGCTYGLCLQQSHHAHWLRALRIVINLFRDFKAPSIGDWELTLGLRIAPVCLRPGFAWREYITIVKTSPNSVTTIGTMYAAQKMRKRTIFSTPNNQDVVFGVTTAIPENYGGPQRPRS